MGLGVDGLRMILERGVHLDDLTTHRRKELRDGLHRFDGSKRLARRDGASRIGQLDEDDVAELILREVGDADLGDVAGRGGSTRGPWCISGLRDTPCGLQGVGVI